MRAVVKVGAGGSGGAVVVDIPLDEQVTHKLHERTGVRLESVFDSRAVSATTARSGTTSAQSGRSVLFERSLAQIEVGDWVVKGPHRDTVVLILQVNGKVRDRVEVPAGLSEEELIALARASEKVQAHLNGKERRVIVVPDKLVNIVV